MNEELHIISEEHGTGKIVSINEDENTAKVEYEDGFEEDIDLDDEFNFDFDEDEDETDVADAGEEDDKVEETDVVEEGRGKKGQARQAAKNASDDDDSYERRGDKPAKGRFSMDRARKNGMQESADLLGLALDKKPTEFSTELSNILQARIADKVADLKLDIAQNLYNKGENVENS